MRAATRSNNDGNVHPHIGHWVYPHGDQPGLDLEQETRPNELFNLRDRFANRNNREENTPSPFGNRIKSKDLKNHAQRGPTDFSNINLWKFRENNCENWNPVVILNAGNRCTCQCHLTFRVNGPIEESDHSQHKICHRLPVNYNNPDQVLKNKSHNYKHNYNYYCYDPIQNVYRQAPIGRLQKGVNNPQESQLCRCKSFNKNEDQQKESKEVHDGNGEGHIHSNSYSPPINSQKIEQERKIGRLESEFGKLDPGMRQPFPNDGPFSNSEGPHKSIVTI